MPGSDNVHPTVSDVAAWQIWESAWDLAGWLADGAFPMTGKRVLELGCGGALPGLVAALHAAEVTLQDLNREVLEQWTGYNARLSGVAERVTLVAGEWAALGSILPEHSFDLILSAETVYSAASYAALAHCLRRFLHPQGCA